MRYDRLHHFGNRAHGYREHQEINWADACNVTRGAVSDTSLQCGGQVCLATADADDPHESNPPVAPPSRASRR